MLSGCFEQGNGGDVQQVLDGGGQPCEGTRQTTWSAPSLSGCESLSTMLDLPWSSISHRCLDAPLDVHHRVGLAALPPILVKMMLAGLQPPSKRPQPRAVSTSLPRTSLFNTPRQGASCGVRTVGDPSDSANHRILAVAVAHSTWHLLQTGSR